MKTDALAALASQLARAAPSLTFPGDGDFASRLTLGQIIKGRVLRSYEGQRYLVDFGDDRRVVDSAVPLRADEVFHGRIVGLGEQVQLQKLAPAASALPAPVAAAPDADATEPLAALFARYRVELPAARIDAAAPVVARLQPTPLAGLGALVLAKLGLPLEPSLIRALHARLAGQAANPADREALRLHTAAPAAATQLESAVPALAAALAGSLAGQLTPETARQAGADAGGGDPSRSRGRSRDAALHILNMQTGGTIAHRLGVLPLIVDGRLVELEVALFDEGLAPDDPPGAAPRHRQIVIGLDTEALGRVEIRARLAGSRMDVAVSTPTSAATQVLSLHGARLAQALEGLGFQVDGLSYATQAAAAPGEPLRRTVEHIVNPGSVSRWV